MESELTEPAEAISPPGPTLSTTTPCAMLPSDGVPNAFIQEPDETLADSNACALEQCQESFAQIEEIFIDIAEAVQCPVSQHISLSTVRRNWNAVDLGTVQTRIVGQLLREHCIKLEKLNKEGIENQFQTFAVVVGDCLPEDHSLGSVIASPGLTNFLANHIKIDENILLGLMKCEAYNVVAEKVTERVDAEQLIRELNQVFDSLEAGLKCPSSPSAEAQDDDEDLIMEEELNILLSCKKHLIKLLNVGGAIEADDQQWSMHQLPWSTLPNYLVSISHIIQGWPLSCPMPHETSIFASSKTWIGKAAPPSAMATHVWWKKKSAIIKIKSDDEETNLLVVEDKFNLTSSSKRQQTPAKPVYTISNDSDSDPIQQTTTKTVYTIGSDSDSNSTSSLKRHVGTDSDSNKPTTAKSQPPPPPVQPCPVKKHLVMVIKGTMSDSNK
ncbi:hypothetical protein H2248_012210 [Termitomyces sp. 'cryptogamus']|nr:hypothetical protein H2248_012210 [Termitomyces sp. 'cryptogamus']